MNSILIQWPVATLIILSATATALCQDVPVAQRHLVDWLASGTQSEREAVVAYVRQLQPNARGHELDLALANELLRLDAERRRRRALSGGELQAAGDFPAEYHAALIEAVGSSVDPVIIPALVGAIDTGRMANRAIAKFGNAAVRPVLAVALGRRASDGTEARPESISGALSTLTLIVSAAQPTELAPTVSAQIADVARERLTGTQHGSVLAAACELAIATREPSLRYRVDELATTPASIAASGVVDPRSIALVQRVCQNARSKR